MVVEYDQELLAPIGVVRDRKQLRGREVVVIEGGSAVMLVPKEGEDSRCVACTSIIYCWARSYRSITIIFFLVFVYFICLFLTFCFVLFICLFYLFNYLFVCFV